MCFLFKKVQMYKDSNYSPIFYFSGYISSLIWSTQLISTWFLYMTLQKCIFNGFEMDKLSNVTQLT